jgi:hypothetical protein
MGRILVLLTFAGLAAVFVIIYNAGKPVQSAAPANSNSTANGNRRPTRDSQPEKNGKAHSTRRAEKRSNTASKASDDQGEVAPATDSSQKPTKAGADPLMTVNSDSAPVYSANSKRSKVLRVLRRGEKVRPDMEVLDSAGRWRIVRGQSKDKPGFVLEDQVERPPAESSKNKNGREQPKQF